jgi:hypothetical protein
MIEFSACLDNNTATDFVRVLPLLVDAVAL